MTATVRRWTRPDSYIGAEWSGWYSAGFGQSRDSDCLERANFQAAWDRLKTSDREVPESDGDATVQRVCENHWAVGWVEWIAIHESDTQALTIAAELCAAVADYPVLDEALLSQLEHEECANVWERCYNTRDRIAYFRRHSYTARTFGDLLRAMRGEWHAAANALHCPSDLLT